MNEFGLQRWQSSYVFSEENRITPSFLSPLSTPLILFLCHHHLKSEK